MCCHRATAKNPIKRGNSLLYKRMVMVGIENWKTFHLLSRTCGKKEVLELERKFISILKADLNIIWPIKVEESKKEYYKKNGRIGMLKTRNIKKSIMHLITSLKNFVKKELRTKIILAGPPNLQYNTANP